ncbi:IclR family transcriptional regulator [Phycicoccus endophyticus]|uniref:IclR family transcriptional regulator n=1 Tax=Phycicoccus endophyticus TaxID=1690220 RepID=A0A7G9R206_9MICO|nr:IclR family transcriptional regulator [Phycicoccus endophyticus]NHI19734.1 IclR family transcriptional regulator [Phycicoccus endophyticus]QNN49631.1 IclR family transcriptional regulator [Phycicoccus endophyticus]
MSEMRMDLASISGSAKGLVKGVAVVDLLAASGRPMRLTDLVDELGLPHATVVRLVDVLVQLDIVRVDERGIYGLGPRTAAWGQAFLAQLDIARLAFDLMETLVAETDETCFLGVLDRGSVLYVAAVSSPQPVRPAATVGSRNPLHSTGIGKCLLAWSSPARRDELLHEPLEARTPNTITERAALLAELERCVERGYVIDDIENEEGVRCVSAPVFDHLGEVVAALSVSAPAYRFSREDVERYGPRVVEIARELSARAGHRLPSRPDDDGPATEPTTPDLETL